MAFRPPFAEADMSLGCLVWDKDYAIRARLALEFQAFFQIFEFRLRV